MKYLLLLFLVAAALSSSAQPVFDSSKLAAKTKKLVYRIAKVNQLMSNSVYYAGIRPEQFDTYLELKKTATKDELIALTDHTNGVVRCYAFCALTSDGLFDPMPILIDHLDDTTVVETQYGCLRSRDRVGNFFINQVSQQLSAGQQKKLDSFLVYTPTQLRARDHAIERTEKTETLYQRLKSLYRKEHNQAALVKLATFQREEDIPLILSNKTGTENDDGYFGTYKAIFNFPHPVFLPLLTKNLQATLDKPHYSNEWQELYNAIARYKNDTALGLLEIPFTQVKDSTVREYHIGFVLQAVRTSYTALYNGLLWKIWEDENNTSTDVFRILYRDNAAKALSLAEKNLRHADELYELFDSNSSDTSAPLLNTMLDTLNAHNRNAVIEIINQNIRKVDVHTFPVFADYAIKIKDPGFVESFFARMEKESNPHVYLAITKTLLLLNDKNINKRLLYISYKNKNMRTGWGGSDFKQLVKNIKKS